MRKTLSIAIVAGLVWAFPAAAVDEHHPEQQKAASTPNAPNDAKTQQKLVPAASKSDSTDAQHGMPMGMMGNMEKMQQQMEKIQATTDPKERQKLMQEHMQSMQENMKAMRGMGGPMMMGSGQPGGMMMGDKKGGKTMRGKKGGMAMGDMMKHHDMMEKRMDMMQMMMEQMMQHDQAAESMSGK